MAENHKININIIPEAPKLLLVDDNINNLGVLQNSLRGKGYSLQVALNGEKAVDLVSINPPHLILLDVMMPGIDGFETCSQLKQIAELKYVPVIFLTAKNETKDLVKGFSSGGIDYLTKPFDIDEVEVRVRTHLELYFERQLRQKHEAQLHIANEELKKTNLEVIERLARASEYRDDQTGLHVKRMSHFSRALGRAYGLGSEECEMLFFAASMHDLGKIGIPDNILLKPGSFNCEEREIMKTHTEIGANILSGSSSKLLKMAALIALTHQEKWDGTGYPKGLKGEEIPVWSRIVAISDVFDALTMERPYKKAWSAEDALVKIKNDSGSHFDPELVNCFSGIYSEILAIRENYKDSTNTVETVLQD
ncbi:MAG: response regulator [Nitrospinae bacterium]|nr:response regulator [Nitrospinota bacterium]